MKVYEKFHYLQDSLMFTVLSKLILLSFDNYNIIIKLNIIALS